MACARRGRAGRCRHLIVLGLDMPDDARLRQVNRRAVEADAAFLPVVLDRHVVSIGPLILPRATACYECLYHRVRAGRRNLEAFEAVTERDHRPSRLAARLPRFAAAVIVLFLAAALSIAQALVGVITCLRSFRAHGRAQGSPLPRCVQSNMPSA